MCKLKVSKIWIPAFLLAALVAGCGDPDKNAGAAGGPLTPPTVPSGFVTPPVGSTVVCPAVPLITATFSKAMNATTINTSTFTLTGPSGAVSGTVTYVVATQIATFIPANPPNPPLQPTSPYTATITTGAADTFGNHLETNFQWTFTTSATCPPPAGPILLGAACSSGILAGSTVTNVAGTATTVSGDVDVWPGTAITGFGPPASITGSFFTGPGPGPAMAAQGALTTAYNNAAAADGGTGGVGTGQGTVLAADIGGLAPFPPGVYRTTSAQPSVQITGVLTLDGGGDPNAVWIFQIDTTLKTSAGNSNVILINSAKAGNVFWQVGSSATLGTNTVFVGNIMAKASITITTGAKLTGRALAENAAVSLDTNTVTVPQPCL